MRAGFRLLAVILVLAMGSGRTAGAELSRAALPPRAHLGSVISLPGSPPATAFTFLQGGWWLAITDGDPHVAPALFRRQLPGVPRLLSTGPGPHTVQVLCWARRPGASLLAFDLRGRRVTSALAGIPSGTIEGDEGITVKTHALVVRNRVASHVGSISYRRQDTFSWNATRYRKGQSVLTPDLPGDAYPVPRAVFHTRTGDTILLRLEVAADEQSRSTGLMNRNALDADSGMIFLWPYDVRVGFWMLDTPLPLSIAFISAEGHVLALDDMEPDTTSMHRPPMPYRYAVEANKGYFATNGIQIGDPVDLDIP